MRPDARRYLVAYDIPDNSRRLRAAHLLEAYGDRVQLSVFVVDAAPVRFARLRRALEKTADMGEDSILCCDLGPVAKVAEHRFVYLGQTRPMTATESFIV